MCLYNLYSDRTGNRKLQSTACSEQAILPALVFIKYLCFTLASVSTEITQDVPLHCHMSVRPNPKSERILGFWDSPFPGSPVIPFGTYGTYGTCAAKCHFSLTFDFSIFFVLSAWSSIR